MKLKYVIIGSLLLISPFVILAALDSKPTAPSPLQQSIDSPGEGGVQTVPYLPGVHGVNVLYTQEALCTYSKEVDFLFTVAEGTKGAKPCINIGMTVNMDGNPTTDQTATFVRVWSASSTQEIAGEVRKAANKQRETFLKEEAGKERNIQLKNQIQGIVR